ncbi:acyl-coenzyme A oxidase 1-like [Battus philenor]|uniref:acyl-coenzyme A oxidase 1-like n=1 Tax=Battus philenor TaxID=42288 RepID=UPI0035CF5BA7
MVANVDVNPDLKKERLKCNFNIEEVTFILDGGKDKTLQRRKIEDIVLNSGVSIDPIPEECLSLKERYDNAVRKSVLFGKLIKNELLEISGLEGFGNSALKRTSDAFFKEVSPFMLHLGMFVPTIIGQCTAEQQSKWLPLALNLKIIGAYAQTELGHGTFIRGLETTATYDPDKEEFVLNSPTLTSSKWWAGGLGNTANHCIVIAQLYTKGQCHGTHPFIVQIRDLETHEPLPGVKVGDIGLRMGFNTADNGFLRFNNYRIPRENMMMKNAKVLKDGTYVKVARHAKLTYGTMVFVRVTMVAEVANNLAKAVTIAVRFSAVRRQSQPKPDEPEPQIIDYLTQQHKLFICISTAHALHITGLWLWRTFETVLSNMKSGNTDSLPELHALSSCLKAVSTSDAAAYIEQCRYACGGHGYMLSSNLPLLYSYVSATRIYEGDYTVLLLQTARFLVKAWEQAENGNPLTPTVSYLAAAVAKQRMTWNDSAEGMICSFEAIAAGKISACNENIRRHMKSGMCFEDAWQLTTVRLVAAAVSHCRAMICRTYWSEIKRLTATSSNSVKIVMEQLASLYLIYWALEMSGDLLRYTNINETDLNRLQQRYEELLALLRNNAVGLVDAFDFRDEILHSTLGAYDGQIYERLMAEAEKSPLNDMPVQSSFQKYIKPLMRGKL